MYKKLILSLSLLFCLSSVEIHSFYRPKSNKDELVGALIQVATVVAVMAVQIKMMNYMTTKSFSIVKNITTRFADVAGIPEAIASVKRLVAHIKNPKQYKEIGAKPPKGILFHGPPGTGKTLLARALAGESGCSFIAISSTDLFDKWIGSSENNLQSLFSAARWQAWWTGKPCIIFIDEFDSLAASRDSAGGFQANIINKFLTEMDGFLSKGDDIIVVAATNRLESLDSAVLRPGRFDEQIYVGTPDVTGRADILKIHMRKIKHAGMDEKNVKKIAFATPGFTGAEIANLVNRAAVIASKKGLKEVTIAEFQDARNQMIVGDRNETKVMTEKEKRVIAYHESGHAMMLLLEPEMNLELHQITICPRGNALGLTTYLPRWEESITSKEAMLHQIRLALGGRAAEELVFGLISTGASSDFKSANAIARRMICDYGMTDEFGMVIYKDRDSEEINRLVKKIIDQEYVQVSKLLEDNIDKLNALSQALLNKDTLDAEEVYELLQIAPPVGVRDEEFQAA